MTASQPASGGAQAPQPDEADIVRDALKDEYDLEKELGRGGMAIVFKARDKALEREVAIKVLPFSLSFDAEFVERFQREARTAAKLEHPNIIPIYRVGKSGRVIYFVMKYVRGKSLSSLIETRGAIPVPELRRLLIECSRALGFAHRHGIVHRDIKPDNIMFDELGQAIVMDFGIAKAQSGARLTGTGMSIGTPHYMSPEQARAQNLDGRSDVYSLGVVAYQCLAGHVPFDGEDSFSIGYKHIMEELPVPPLEHADQRELFTVIQKMMAKKPEDRFQSADDAVRALETLGGTQQSLGLSDMATMQTLAMEPMKAPPRVSTEKTTPLPRASGSMGKPAEADAPAPSKPGAKPAAAPPPAAARPAAPAPAAKPAPPPRAKPSFRPTQKPRSKAPYVILGVIAVAAAALGGYMIYGRPTGTQVALQPPPDTAPRATPPDTAKAQAVANTTATLTPPADTHRAATTPPRTTTTPPRTATATPPRTAPTPSTTAPRPTVAPSTTGGTGNLMIQGTPEGARILVDGVSGGFSRIGLSAGPHQLRVEAAGFQPYTARVDVPTGGRTATQRVTMVRSGSTPAAAATAAPTTPAAAGAPPPECATNPAFGVRNLNGVCYTERPVARTAPQVPAPASCPARGVTQANVLVKVTPTGDVELASIRQGSNCPAFTDQALAFARDLAYRPATKGGVAVVAWVIQPIRPAPAPRQ